MDRSKWMHVGHVLKMNAVNYPGVLDCAGPAGEEKPVSGPKQMRLEAANRNG